MSEYLKQRMAHILAGRPPKEKPKKVKDNKDGLTIFFQDMRKKMVGVCQCGCGAKSQKHDDTFYRHCICHIFPKSLFPTIAEHPLNWVERTFWGGCHTNMDDRSIELWSKMADFDDIKEKFHQLAPLLTDEERAKKFYSNLEKLVYAN